MLRSITPGVTLNIRDEVRTIRSSVIVCNHLSYLDPILLISLFEKQKTIVKNTFFNVPVFSWTLCGSPVTSPRRRETITRRS